MYTKKYKIKNLILLNNIIFYKITLKIKREIKMMKILKMVEYDYSFAVLSNYFN